MKGEPEGELVVDSPGKGCPAGFSDINSAVLILKELQVLAVIQDGWASFQGSSGPYMEHHGVHSIICLFHNVVWVELWVTVTFCI